MIQPQNKRVLIVEDEKDLREILTARFEMFGFQTSQAEGGDEALALFKSEGGIDIIVTDMRMPKGSGLELLKNVKKLNPLLPKVFLVSAADGLQKRSLYDAGAEGFLEKPYDTRVLIEMVRKSFLSNKEQWQIAPSLTADTTLKLKFESYASADADKQFRLGRGGFCAVVSQDLPVLEKAVNFEIEARPFKITGMARLKWLEKKNPGDKLAGFEFLHLRSEGANEVYQWIDTHSPVAFIPGGF